MIRLAEEPRAVELEVAAPLGTRSLEPLDETLRAVGARAVGKVAFSTARCEVLVAKLVEANGRPLDAERVGVVLDAVRCSLSAFIPSQARAA
jgi:hypothetical protein